MKIVHVNFDGAETGGATIAMLRIHRALKNAGEDSVVACKFLPEDGCAVQLKRSVLCECCQFCSKAIQKVVYRRVGSTGLFASGMGQFVRKLNPDIVHMHWLQGGTIGIRELLSLNRPIVFSLHDLWSMSDTNPYPETDWFKSGVLDGKRIVDKLAWRNKLAVIQKLKGRVTAVGPSEWVSQEARESKVFQGCRVAHIPYPLSSELEAEWRKPVAAKKANEHFTILFGATTGISSPIKGWDRLMAALDLLTPAERSQMCIRVFGCAMPECMMHGVPVTFLGRLSGEPLLQEYRNANVFAFPSRRETWGQTKTEAMCCGTYVVAFDQTACAEGIRHKIDGWIAPKDDVVSYAEGLRWVYEKWRHGIMSPENKGVQIAELVSSSVASRWIDLYTKILAEG